MANNQIKTTTKKAKSASNTSYDRFSDNGGAIRPAGTKSSYNKSTKKK